MGGGGGECGANHRELSVGIAELFSRKDTTGSLLMSLEKKVAAGQGGESVEVRLRRRNFLGLVGVGGEGQRARR